MKISDLLYVRYIGNIRHWSREVFQAPITWIGSKHFTLAINGQPSRFERHTLAHDNRGRPTYQVFLTLAAYEQAVEVAELRNLMSRTDFVNLPIEQQRSIRAILNS